MLFRLKCPAKTGVWGNTGDWGVATNTGDWGVVTNTGDVYRRFETSEPQPQSPLDEGGNGERIPQPAEEPAPAPESE